MYIKTTLKAIYKSNLAFAPDLEIFYLKNI